MPTPLLPDHVALSIEAISAQAPIAALVSSRVYDRIPANATFPLLVVNTIDEAETPHSSVARVQVDAWGDGSTPADEQQANLIARTLVSVVRDLRGVWSAGKIANSGHLSTVPSPDPDGRSRFVIDIEIEAHPL